MTLPQKLEEFSKLLIDNNVSSIILESFNDLRNYIADNLREASDFVASKERIEQIQGQCKVQSVFNDFVNPFQPELVHLRPEQIALSLGREYRFWNQTELTVAEHCVNMAQFFQDKYPNQPEFARWAMIHEIGEVTLGDTATPIKDIVPGIRKNENILLAKYAKEQGLSQKMPNEVHILDKRMMITEAHAYMPNKEYWDKVARKMSKKLKHEIVPLSNRYIRETPLIPDRAIELFANKWLELDLPVSPKIQLMAEGKIREAITGETSIRDIRMTQEFDSLTDQERRNEFYSLTPKDEEKLSPS